MKEILTKILQVIENVARDEEAKLSSAGSAEGIFNMPELAFVYDCGKAIMLNRRDIFGEVDVKWEREVDLKNGGPTDLVFRLQKENRLIAIEFKLRDTKDAYLRDVSKLLALSADNVNGMEITRVFCALVDTFSHKCSSDTRITSLDNDPRVRRINQDRLSFKTSQSRYSSDVSCVVCLWEVVG
jgi:hypothetical protein